MTKAAAPSSLELEPNLIDATADTALLAISRAAADAEALIQAWIQRSNAAAISEVAERGTGQARKSARRALNVLRSRGVRVPERRRVASVNAPSEELHEAWLLAPDGAGNVLLVFTAHNKTSRYRSAFVVMHEALGIHRVDLAELSQSQLKDAMAKFIPGADYRAVRVPVPWARARVAQARKRHAQRGIPEPLGLTSAAALLEPVPSQEPQHPFEEEGLELSDDDARELTKQSARLHALPEFRGWFPAREAIDELLAKVGESLDPGDENDADKMRACMDREIAAATDRYFSPQRREQLVSSLKDSAISVLQREGEVIALELVAAMKLIERAGLITDPPHEVPFLRAFFEKAISVLAAQGQGRLRIPIRPKPSPAEAASSEAPSSEAASEPEPAPEAAPTAADEPPADEQPAKPDT
jgi:hypothetical protein